MENIRITTKADYFEIVNFLEKKTKYVELLRLLDDQESTIILNKYKYLLVTEKNVSNWNNSGAKGTLFKFDIDLVNRKKFFNDLRKIDSFFYNHFDVVLGSSVDTTEFGYMNIAFFDLNGKLLFYTSTHEGLAWIENEFLL